MISARNQIAAPDEPPYSILPALSARQSALLSDYIASRGDLAALLETRKIPATELLEWSQNPAVQAHLAALKSLADFSLAYRASQSRTAALASLESIMSTASQDPVEQRRAASAIAAVADARDRATDFGCVKSVSSLRARGSRASAATDSEKASHLERHCPPAYVPAPSLTANDVAGIVTSALHTPGDTASLQAIAAFLAPDATFDGEPAGNTDDFIDAAADALNPGVPVVQCIGHPGVPAADTQTCESYRLWLVHKDGGHTCIHMELARAAEGPHSGCWLIASLDVDDSG